MFSSRAAAAQIIARVLRENLSLTAAFLQGSQTITHSRDRSFTQELCYGVIRWYRPLEQLCFFLLKKPLSPADQDIYALLLLGLYQLYYLETAPYAAVYETVQAARELKKNWAVPLVNGVLRSVLHRRATLLKKLSKEVRYSHPRWLVEKLRLAWPDHWEAILDANNRPPPMSLRVNTLKISRDAYIKKLSSSGIVSQLSDLSAVGLILERSSCVEKLPGFIDGEFSVQDTAAQLAAPLLRLQVGQRVLDACAAPGGKTAHILETQSSLQLCMGVDSDPDRLNRVMANLLRLNLMQNNVELYSGKAEELHTRWQNGLFDRILLDAPCSGTGVIRKHPDIKLLRRKQDIPLMVEQQYRLLVGLWPLLKTAGILLYSTCSLLPEENTEVLQRFLSHHFDAKELVIDAKWGMACSIGRQILPDHHTSGFYYARLSKK